MLVKQSEAKVIPNSKKCTIWEYPVKSKNLSFATAQINGRYPDKGNVVNTECETIYFILNGKGIIHSRLGDFEINKNDVYHFTKGEQYWIEGQDLELAEINSPKWFEEQYKEIT